MRSAGSVLVAVVFLFVMGCQRESRVAVSPEPQPPQVSSEQQELLEEILQYTRDTGSTVEQLAEEARRREALEQAPRGVAAIGDDLRVAKALVAAARSAATSKQSEKTAAALGRLAPTLTVLRSEIPAAAIAQHLERALVAISSLLAPEAVNVASGSLLAAIDTAIQAPAPLVPEVVKAVERAKSSVDANQLENAAGQILEILGKLQGDDTVEMLDRMLAGVRGAHEALSRHGWLVVTAELDQLDAALSQLQEKVGGVTTVTEEPGEGIEATKAEGEAEEVTKPEAAAAVESAEPEPSTAPR